MLKERRETEGFPWGHAIHLKQEKKRLKSDWLPIILVKTNKSFTNSLILLSNLLSSAKSGKHSTHDSSSESLVFQVLYARDGGSSRGTHLVLQFRCISPFFQKTTGMLVSADDHLGGAAYHVRREIQCQITRKTRFDASVGKRLDQHVDEGWTASC